VPGSDIQDALQVPAQQRLKAHDAPHAKMHDRLIIDAKLVLTPRSADESRVGELSRRYETGVDPSRLPLK
jgi:hypothetical protein